MRSRRSFYTALRRVCIGPRLNNLAVPSMLIDPELYALVHCGTPGDVEFYLREANAACSVLELGCGAGRILLPLAAAGHRIVGLDMEDGALALTAAALETAAPDVRRRIRLVSGDMCAFSLEDRFDLILIPYNTLYCLGDRTKMLRCLRCAKEHLTPNGRIVWDAYAIDDFHAHSDPVSEDESEALDAPVVSVQLRDTVYDVYETTRWDRDAQRLEVSYRYAPRNGTPVTHETLDHCYLLTHQVAPLCEMAGIELVTAHGDFEGAALTPHSQHMVCTARAR